MKTLVRLAAGALAIGALASANACADSTAIVGGGTPSGDGDAGANDGDLFGEVGSADAATGLGCSGDLLHVVDSKGNTVANCPPDQGCYGGACIPACDAAAQSKGSIGCDFLVPTPAWGGDFTAQPCYAIYLANNWDDNLTVTVEYDGAMLDPSKFARVGSNDPDPTKWSPIGTSGLTPSQVAILFMSADPTSEVYLNSTTQFPQTCAVSPAVPHDTTIPNVAPYKGKSGIGKAFHVRTSRPVSAYDIWPFGGATSFETGAELLLPTSAWSPNYVVTASPGGDVIDPMYPDRPLAMSVGFGYLQLVAMQDGTHVQVAVTKDIVVGYTHALELPAGPSVSAAPAGAVTTYTLDAGQYIQWSGSGGSFFPDPLDTTGTIFSSDKPVGVFSGDSVMEFGRSAGGVSAGSIASAADGERHEILPVGAMGFEYLAAPFATRRSDLALEDTGYRLMAFVDGTTLTFDPPLAGAPTTLDKGQHTDFVTAQPFVVRSQDKSHPFYLAQMMSGATANPSSRPGINTSVESKLGGPFMYGSLGDPDFLPLVPPAQFLSHYAFFTDPTYATTNLVLTRAQGTDGAFKDVTVDCLGPVAGWAPLGSDGRFQYAIVDLVRANVGVGTCQNGAHAATSGAPFGLYVWGTDFYCSYSYPAGGNVARINDVVVPPVPN